MRKLGQWQQLCDRGNVEYYRLAVEADHVCGYVYRYGARVKWWISSSEGVKVASGRAADVSAATQHCAAELQRYYRRVLNCLSGVKYLASSACDVYGSFVTCPQCGHEQYLPQDHTEYAYSCACGANVHSCDATATESTPVGAPSQDCLEYTRLLVALHQLVRKGEGDGEAADRIRDEMDCPGRRLSPMERTLVSDASGGLDMLADDEVYEPRLEGLTDAQLVSITAAAVHRGEWRTVLTLLRMHVPGIDGKDLAHLRSRAYAELGLPDLARAFFEYILPRED